MTDYKLMVCPHDTANNPERWYYLTQHLSELLGGRVSFDNYLDFEEFHANIAEADLLYGNPQDTVTMVKQHNFTPLVRPDGMFDEVVFVAGEEVENPTVASLEGQKIGSVNSMLPTKIALHVLNEQGIKPEAVVDHVSWLAVINDIIKGELAYGFVYKDTYDDLSPMSKEMLQPFYTSKAQTAFHCLSLSPTLAEHQAQLLAVLTEMHQSEAGQTLLEKLEIKQWLPVETGAIDQIDQILTGY